jgi:hypothetical protein
MAENRRDVFEATEDKKSSGNKDKDKIKSEIEAIIRKGPVTQTTIAELIRKYPNTDEDIIYALSRKGSKEREKRVRAAKEIAEKVYKKFSSGKRPFHEILEKMMKYKNDNKWSDVEYDEFRKQLQFLLTGVRASEVDYNQNIATNRSRINRALGNSRTVIDDGLKIKETEHGTLAKILSMYDNSKSIHNAVYMHSLMYEDCSLVATTGEYKRERHIASNYIHPLIACMFIPKFDIFEITMLYPNF